MYDQILMKNSIKNNEGRIATLRRLPITLTEPLKIALKIFPCCYTIHYCKKLLGEYR